MGLFDFLGDIPIVGDIVDVGGDILDFAGKNPTGTASILESLGGLGQQLLQNGISEEELQIQRDKLALEAERIRGDLSLGREKLALDRQTKQIEVALAAMKVAREGVPDATAELKERRDTISQRGADANTQLKALDGLVSRFQGALK